ncbi:MAG TPA: right-handed parallel beta-helix repeat-containing protein, partial [Blastocatellia bacterium]|nr:right-handed parallel beta-helix repeat-containing protein [Blastocatellia bacterium]
MFTVRRLTILALVALSAILLSLKSPAVQSVSAGHRAPDILETSATFTVTNADDGGTGSLRAAMGSANISGGADTIVFDPAFFNTPRTINLTGELPPINDSLTITGPGAHLLTVRRNTGGNYRIFTINSGVTAAISGLTISNGNAGTGDGGGILNNGTLTITNCHITGNTAVGGGGISNTLGNLLTLTQSTVSNNTATGSSTGGGIASIGGTTITNSTISGNIVTGSGGGNGGGLRLSSAGAGIANSTITNNSAAGPSSAGGLRDNLAPVNIRNSIIAGNLNNATVPDVLFAGGGDLQSGGFNLIGNRGTLTFSGTNDQSGTSAAPLDPQLARLGIFGGTTPVHALLLTSPAFDKGAVDSPIATDQRGFNRRADIAGIPNAPNFGDASDIGAVEMQTVFVTNTNDSGAGSLRQLILGAPAGSDITFDPTVFNVARTITLTGGEIAFSKSLTVSGPGANLLTVSGNNASRIFNISGSGLNVAISGLTISNGRGGAGGGVIVTNSIGTFADCTFTGNTAVGNEGGAVQLANAGGTFTGCTFSGNTAGGNRGGAVSVENSSAAFTNCTVSGNTANFGAGIALFNPSGNRTLSITNCTITGNNSQGNNASGLLVEVAAGLTTTATVRNSIIANNSGTDNVRGLLGGALSPATLISQGFNLTSDNSTAFLNQATDITNTNPQLGPLQNNGGATPTHVLLPNSPAIDKGSAVAGLTVDQRGRTRPFDVAGVSAANGGDSSDIGA